MSLAVASSAIVIGFNVRPTNRPAARREGRRRPPAVPRHLRRARRRQGGPVGHARAGETGEGPGPRRGPGDLPGAKLGVIAGCSSQGTITRDSRARLVRDGVVVYAGRVGSLRRFKDDVSEVARATSAASDRGLPGRQGGRRHRDLRGPRGALAPSDSHAGRALCGSTCASPAAHSLKQKRHVVKSLTAAVRSKFNVSVAEVDHHDLWQRTTLAVAATGARGTSVPHRDATGWSGSWRPGGRSR